MTTKKKKTAPKKRRKSKKKLPGLTSQMGRILAGVILLVIIAVAGALVVRDLIPRHAPEPLPVTRREIPQLPAVQPVQKEPAPVPPVSPKPVEPPTAVLPPVEAPAPPAPAVAQPSAPPTYEIYPPAAPPPPSPPPKPSPSLKPEVAIIIDDIGYDRQIAEDLLSLDIPLTFSVLPFSPFKYQIIREARKKGIELMLHLPMEPEEYPRVNPGPGALLVTMSPDALVGQLIRDLDDVPFIRGVNNHMGSRFTADGDKMNQIFTVLKRRDLYFIDSRTTAETRVMPAARLFKIPFSQRDVFLDHSQDPRFIRGQIRELIRVAVSHGRAVGIGHPHLPTYQALKEALPDLTGKLTLVPASKIVRPVP